MEHVCSDYVPYYYSGYAKHTHSIRRVCPNTNGLGLFATGAYDNSVIIWSAPDVDGACQPLKSHKFHDNNVSAVLTDVRMKWKCDFGSDSETYESIKREDIVVSGSQDNLIIGWSQGSALEFILAFHTQNVSCLCRWTNGIISGSWDRIICVWNEDGGIHQVLKGHREAVLCVCVIKTHSRDIIMSGSGDRRILSWHITTGEVLREYNHHGDSVRDIIPDEGCTFWSCGNDCNIFKVNLEGHILSKLSGHQSFVYQLCKLSSVGIASVSEDRSLRIWVDGEIKQVIYHPDTVWSLSVMRDGSVATGCADGYVRIWSQVRSDMLSADSIEEFAQKVAQCEIPHDVKIPQADRTLDSEFPCSDGTYEGELVHTSPRNDILPVYTWSSGFKTWQQVGFQKIAHLSSPDTSPNESFLFNIEIDGNVLQLPFQRGQSPQAVAKQFVQENNVRYGLNDSHVTEVAKFIIKNANVEYCEE